MSHVKVTNYHEGENIFSAYGTRLEIDGKEMQDVSDIDLHFPVDGMAEVRARMFITEPFEFVGDAHVTIEVTVPHGFQLVMREENGKTIYSCEHKTS